MKKRIALLLTLFLPILTIGQNNSVFNCHSYQPYDRYLYKQENRFHTTIKPYNLQDVNEIVHIDTLYNKPCKNKVINHILNNNLISYNSEDLNFTINPSFNFELSQHTGENNDKLGWINDRGIFIKGNITDKVHFYTCFHEIQSNFSDYRNDIISKNSFFVPGIEFARHLGEHKDLDYAYVEGYASYTPNKIFNFQLGHGKNFIGDGYRSLLLSDNSSNYPYFKITTNFKNIRYLLLYSQQYYKPYGRKIFVRYSAKWNYTHYLDWSITKWFTIGLFESIISASDSTNTHTFDINYINPLPIVIPRERDESYRDNCIIGITGKITPFVNHIFYGQFFVNTNEFKLQEMFTNYWGNRIGYQLGYKTFDIAKIKHLDFQTEFNYVKPFTYSHNTTSGSYTHAQQTLAHPYGANFYESVSFLRYNWKRIFFATSFDYIVYGADTASANNGNNIKKTFITRNTDYPTKYINGDINKNIKTDFSISYLLNPLYNMNITLGTTYYCKHTSSTKEKQLIYYIGFRTNLGNFYYD